MFLFLISCSAFNFESKVKGNERFIKGIIDNLPICDLEVIFKEDNPDLNLKIDSETLIARAIKFERVELVDFILKRGIDVNLKDESGITLLMLSSQIGHLEILKLLILAGANINEKNNNGFTALLLATSRGHEIVVRFLLEKGAKVDAKTDNGDTALIIASRNGDEGIVIALLGTLKRKIKLDERNQHSSTAIGLDDKNRDGETAIEIASLKGYEKIVKLLVMEQAKIGRGLMMASLNGHEEVIKVFLERKAILNEKYVSHARELLSQAHESLDDYESKYQVFMQDMQDVNQDGFTPLMYASQNGHEKVVSLMLKAGAKIDERNGKGTTALMLSSCNGHEGVVKLLLQAGAKIDEENRDIELTLMYAASKGYSKVVVLLLICSINSDKTNKFYKQVLKIAKEENKPEIIKLLELSLEDLIKYSEQTDLLYDRVIIQKIKHIFEYISLERIEKAILSSSDDLICQNIKGVLPFISFERLESLFISQLLNNVEFTEEELALVVDKLSISFLSTYCIDISLWNKVGYTGIHLAVASNKVEILKTILSNETSLLYINKQETNGLSPLRLALSLNRNNIKKRHIELLLSYGASPLYKIGLKEKSLLKKELKDFKSYIKNESIVLLLSSGQIDRAAKMLYGYVVIGEDGRPETAKNEPYKDIIDLSKGEVGNVFHYLAACSSEGQENAIEEFLERAYTLKSFDKSLLLAYDKEGYTPIQLAIMRSNHIFLEKIIEDAEKLKLTAASLKRTKGISIRELILKGTSEECIKIVFNKLLKLKDSKLEEIIKSNNISKFEEWIIQHSKREELTEAIDLIISKDREDLLKVVLERENSIAEEIFIKSIELLAPKCFELLVTSELYR